MRGSHECSLLEQQKRVPSNRSKSVVSLNRRHAFRFIDRTYVSYTRVYVHACRRYLTMRFDEYWLIYIIRPPIPFLYSTVNNEIVLSFINKL